MGSDKYQASAPPGGAPQASGEAGSNRREFLRVAAGAVGAGAGLALTACGSSKADVHAAKAAGSAGHTTRAAASKRRSAKDAASVRKLTARAGGTTKHGVQHLASRADLRPPEIRIDVRARNVAPGVVLTDSHAGPSQQGPLILNLNGRLIWFNPLARVPTPARRAFNLRVQSYRGEPVLTWFEGAVVSAHGLGHYEIWDQQYRRVAQVYAGNGYQADLHEFLLTDRGTALFTCYGRAIGNLPVGGGTRRGAYFYGVVQEVDVATGKVLFQWRSDEHVGFSASYQRVPAKPSNTWDYFHVNSIAVDPTDQNLLISSRNTWACYKVDRTTGKVLWKLGGKHGDFKMGPRTHFAFQHHVTLYPGGVLTIFDNEGGPPNEASQSRGLVLSIDEKRRRASFRKQYLHHPPVLSQALGSMQQLAGGHAFVGWGSSSYFTEYGSRGQVLFDGRLAPGTSSYRAFKQPWTGRPARPPDVTAVRHGKGTRVSVSWNGATDVWRWSVLGGPDAQHLTQLGTATVAGFETDISVPNAPAVIAVEALDGAGNALGRSAPVRI